MNRFFVAVFAAFIGLVITVPEAEAKRFGGSRSFGMQRDSNTFRKAAPPTNNAAPTRNNATPAAAQPPKRSWMGPLAGLAAGLGLAALMSHLGLGEEFGSIILMALLAFGAIMLVKMLMRRAAAPQPSGAAAGAAGAGAMRYAGNEAPATASHAGSGAASVPGAADGFDAPAFERQAKLNFIRLQAASDSGNLEDIRQFTTPEVFAELSLQLGEREPGVHRTDVLELDAEVVDVSEVDAQHVVTVRFSGMLREEQDAAASPFSELWHLTKPVIGNGGWRVAGLQQLD